MKRIGSIICSIIGAATIVCGVALAQSKVENQAEKNVENIALPAGSYAVKVHDEGMMGGGMAKSGVTGPTVKGAPYSADGVTDTTQTLGDGTHINRQETYSIYRDGEGRVRRENGEHAWISDPVAKRYYLVNTKQQTARKLGLSITRDYKTRAGAQSAKWKAEAVAEAIVFKGGVMMKAGAEKSEALGKQAMEGLEVDGTRSTSLIPQGQIGNDRPIQTVHERWESGELHVTILSKHSDPMMGDTVERLTNVRRGEPDPALFQVPAGFTVESVESDE